jgi:NAD(P)-dependent dehydrogenase (short-subunit alcohol dehydrogenase family)
MRSVHWILGASGGIGSALSRRLAGPDSSLVLSARDETRLQALADEAGGAVRPLDVTDAAQVDAAAEAIVAEYGRIDGIALCVGSILLKPAHRTSDEEWRQTLALNLDSAFHVVRAGAKAMLKTGGSIVLLSSAAARFGLPNHEAIAAAKAGVVGLATSAAASYAPRGIRVNVVAPGMVETPLSEPLLKSAATAEASKAMHPLGRLGSAEDVASAIAWFLDPGQSWVTGQVLGVDGGLAAVRGR